MKNLCDWYAVCANESLVSLRKQSGSAVGVSLSAVLMSERSNQQLKDLLKSK